MRMSVDEFLDWDSGDSQVWQLVDGEPKAIVATTRTHWALHGEIAALIQNRLVAIGSACSVLIAPGVTPRVQAHYNMRVPDIAVTCTDYQVEGDALTGPLLIVEIISPSNQAGTWSNIWTYATIPSVREILVLLSMKIGADLLRRCADGSWQQEPENITVGYLVLESIGFRVPLADIYRTTRLRRPADE